MNRLDIWDKRTCIHALASALVAMAVAVSVCAVEGDFSTPAQAAPASVSQGQATGCTGTSTAIANAQGR